MSRSEHEVCTVKFSVETPQGPVPAVGEVRIPSDAAAGASLPVVFVAGYTLDTANGLSFLGPGHAVASLPAQSLPPAVAGNPAARGLDLDRAWLDAVRRLPFIDESRVVLYGASAGGYMAMMLAADAGPVAGVIAETPILDLGYTLAYGLHNRRLDAAGAVPALGVLEEIARQATERTGQDVTAESWDRRSPLAHAHLVEAPVLVVATTADVLVPIEQVDGDGARPRTDPAFPDGFSTAAEVVLGRRRPSLVDVLGERRDVSKHVVAPPADAPAVTMDDLTPLRDPTLLDLPTPERGWSVVIVDEGPMAPRGAHFAVAIGPSYGPFTEMCWS